MRKPFWISRAAGWKNGCNSWRINKSTRTNFAGWWNRRRRPRKWRPCGRRTQEPCKSKNSEIRCYKLWLIQRSRQLSRQHDFFASSNTRGRARWRTQDRNTYRLTMPNNHKSGTVIQRTWWRIRDLYQELKPCRFSFLVALVACPVFLCVAQGTEILRTVGEGMAGGLWYWPRVFGFFAALILWALSSWYAARVLLYLDFPSARGAQSRSKAAEKQVPRLLGIAPILIVGSGFWVAASSYDRIAPAKFWLHCFAGLCAVLAIAFYILLIVRRKWIGAAPQEQVKHVTQLGRTTIVAVRVMLIVSLLLFIVFAAAPVPVPQWLGIGTILFLAAASWISFGSLLVYLGGRWQFPVNTIFMLLALLFSFWNDNHVIRVAPPQE